MKDDDIRELIDFARNSLENAGFTENYITSLSYTWNAFQRYCLHHPNDLNMDIGHQFLFEKYGIPIKNGYFSLRKH